VRGVGHEQTRTFDPDLLRRDGLRPASELITSAPSPLWPGLLAALAAVLMVVLPFLAPASAAHPSVVDGLTVAGLPVSAPVVVDFSEPVALGGEPESFTVNAAGIPLGSVDVATGEPSPLLRWLVGGAATGELTKGGETQAFTVETRNHPLASVMGAGSVLLGLFAVAYIESLSRALRRGYRRPAAPVAALPLGALLGAAVWLLVCAVTAKEPDLAYGVAATAAGAVAAAALVLATAWSARRR
jgi:eukaryotic-like serine/threonine-protein kinase